MKDYRIDRYRKDWWNTRMQYFAGLTRRDVSYIAAGFLLVALYLKFPINWHWVYKICFVGS